MFTMLGMRGNQPFGQVEGPGLVAVLPLSCMPWGQQ